MKKHLLFLVILILKNVATQAQCTAIASFSDATCYGYCDGAAFASGTNGTPPYVFYWSNSMTGATISNLCPGTYYVTMTDGAGCIDYDTVTITQPPPLQINETVTNPSCSTCTDGFASLAVTGGSGNYSYVWCTGANTPFTNIGVGCCGFAVTDNSSGCVQMDSVCASFTVGEKELNYNESIQLFPNPANNEINIIFLNSEVSGNITLCSTYGKILITEKISSTKNTIDISSLPIGLYIFTISVNENIFTKKIIKQ
jgi:hypothetical protein